MAVKRINLQASPEFVKRMKILQGKIKATEGNEPSLTKLTDEIIKNPTFQDIEQQIIKKNDEKKFNLKVRFD